MSDLTTVDKVRALLGIDSVEADEILQDYVSGASAWFTGQVGRDLSSKQYTEVHDGNGRAALMLDQSPVTAITSVKVDGVTVSARASVTGDGWVRDGDLVRLVGATFTKGVQNVEVVYTAGFATIPADVERAVAIVAAMRFREKDRLGQASRAVAGETADFRFGSDPGFAFVKDVIEFYRLLPRAG